MTSTRRAAATALAGALWTLGTFSTVPAVAAPISGAPNPDAATALTDGTWTDQLGAYKSDTGKRHYRVQRPAIDQTVHVGALANTDGGGFRLQAGPDGENDCMSSDTSSAGEGAVASAAGSVFESCAAELSSVVTLGRHAPTGSVANQEALDVTLRSVTVPRPKNYEQLPEILPDVPTETLAAGAPSPLKGSSKASEPTPVKNEQTYSLTLTPGQPVYLETAEIDWGRYLTVQADLDPATAASPEQLEVRVLGPSYAISGSNRLLLKGGSKRATVTTKPVIFRSYKRFANNVSFLAGKHVVALSVSTRQPGSQPVSLTLTTRIGGETRGVPDFGGVRVGPDAGPAWKSWAPWALGVAGVACWVAAGALWVRHRRAVG